MKGRHIFAAILAGGSGSRMGNADRPKQFLEIGNRPILIHTVEKFILHPDFEKILILAPRAWMMHAQDLVRKYIPVQLQERICVIEGGSSRNETIMNAIAFMEKQGVLDEDAILVTHDSVRPFVSRRIIEENIQAASEYGACDTVVPATDTIVESIDGEQISQIPDRTRMYQGQTPQSFRAVRLRDLYESLTDEEKQILTDACKILVIKGEKVRLVMGDMSNIKITYPEDLRMAEALYAGDAGKKVGTC